jgi:hypothetical protein
MIHLRHKYCISAFKAILFVIGLTFFVVQASFKFYRFASFPFGESVTRAISHGSIAGGTKDFLNYNKQAKISLVLDKRYDFKHVFISPAPLLRLAILPIENYKCFFTLNLSFAARASQVISMRGPPCLDNLLHMA